MTDEPRAREQEIAPCPMPGCGGMCEVRGTLAFWVRCECGYEGTMKMSPAEASAAHNALCADVRRGREAEAIERERDALRAEVERLREAIERWADSIGELYSSNDLRGTDYFDYELKEQMEDEMQQVVSALRGALDGSLTVCPDCGGSGYISDLHGSGEFCGCNGELVRRAALDAGQGGNAR